MPDEVRRDEPASEPEQDPDELDKLAKWATGQPLIEDDDEEPDQ